MTLQLLDDNFNTVGLLNPINIQWNRKYYEAGTFSIQIKSTEYVSTAKYLYNNERPEIGLIQKVQLTENIKGKFIQLSGFFAEKLLDDKILYPTAYGNGNIETELRTIFTDYKDDIPNLYLGEVNNVGSSVQFQATGDFMGSKFYELLNLQGLSYKCAYDYLTNKINFSIWQGKDRTQSQNTNSFIIFSTEFNNISNIDITTDESNYRNYAVVGGSGDGDERIYVTVDLSNGGYKKKIFLDKKSIRYDPGEQTLAEYKAELETEGKKEMLKYQLQNNIDIDTKNSGYEYMVDYDLGDKCDIIISDLNLSLEARIIEIYEVLKENTHTIELILGDKKITNYEKARLTK